MFKKLIVFSILVVAGVVSAQEGPPTVNGVIKDPTLVQNQNIAKAQAVGAITTFMNKGAQECDAEGKNCRSLFGSDDSMDYSSMQMSTKALTGVDSFSFAGDDDSSNSVSSQMGTAALACGDKEVKMVAGVAIKMLECSVAANGNAQAKVQVCTATARGNPVVNPDNAVPCSSDPSAPNFKAPFGQVCMKPACDTEPVNSLNGWSSPATINWQASLPANATDAEKSNNGLAMVFYPALTGGVSPSFSADSDNMTALKIVQSFKDNETGASAIGLRVAYRYKVQITKDMLAGGSAAVPNPKDHSSSWETIEKLQGNALIPQYQAKYAANGSECLQQIQNGIASDGVVSVCDPGYTNESGIRPIALTAQVAPEGQDCSSVPQCLKEVVNTNTWKESCSADVPLAMRSCSTKQDYTMEKVSYTRTRSTEICHEERVTAEYSCQTVAVPKNCTRESLITSGGLDLSAQTGDSSIVLVGQVDPVTYRYRFGTIGDNYWSTGYYKREFTVDIRDVANVRTFRIYHVGFDDLLAVSVNGNWLWSDYNGGSYNSTYDQWGRWYERQYCPTGTDDSGQCTKCAKWYDYGDGSYCTEWVSAWETSRTWQSQWERSTNWDYDANVDFRPYLREGRNTIRIDTGVVDGGEGWIFLEISAWEDKCSFDVVNECAAYEAAQ